MGAWCFVVVVDCYIVLLHFPYKNSSVKPYVSSQGVFVTFSYKSECFKVTFKLVFVLSFKLRATDGSFASLRRKCFPYTE